MNEHDQQVRHLLDAGDLRDAAALVVEIFAQRLATIVLQHVRKHEPSIAALSNSRACETDTFQELHDHVVDSILLPDALAAALADFDPHRGSVSAWLAKRVHWSCSDWYRRRPSLPQTIDSDELLSSVPSRPEDDELLCEQRSHDFDSCLAGLPNKQQAVMLLLVDPFYSMTPAQVDLIYRVANDTGQPPEVTRQRIDEMREQNREPIAAWYATDAQIQSLRDDVSEQERESQFRRARLIQAGLSETQIRILEDAAQASREIRVVESRYNDLNPHDSLRQDQKHLELSLVRLALALRRLEKSEVITVPSAAKIAQQSHRSLPELVGDSSGHGPQPSADHWQPPGSCRQKLTSKDPGTIMIRERNSRDTPYQSIIGALVLPARHTLNDLRGLP